MELKWWPVAGAGFAGVALIVAAAVLLPASRLRGELRPLAHTSRLTRLPEYVRMARSRMLALLVTVGLLGLSVAGTVVASARPTGWAWSRGDVPVDVMVCVGEPVTEPAAGDLLSYFARQATTFGTERIGLTSPTRRVVPLTRDYQYAAAQFGEYAQVSRQPAAAVRAAAFAPTVTYVDYAASVDDVLALCMTGFPPLGEKSDRARSLIYLGPATIRQPDEARPSLFVDQAVVDMARRSDIQVNAITTSPRGREAGLRSITEATGGTFFSYTPDQLPANLDAIRAAPPAAGLPGGATVTGWSTDTPAAALLVAVVAAGLLSVSLLVLRR